MRHFPHYAMVDEILHCLNHHKLLPQSLPHSNIKEENNKEEAKEDNSPTPNSNIVLTLSELKGKLMNDSSWQQYLSSQLAKNGINLNAEALSKELQDFFDMLDHKGCKGKEEADCCVVVSAMARVP